MKKAKKKLGEALEAAKGVPAAATVAGPGADRVPGSTAESVETMLRELSSGAGAGRRPQPGTYDQLWQLSMADPHTGLANRLLLLDRLTQALLRRRRHGGEVAACRIELDNLAEVNMTLGFSVGNAVLCEIARRLSSVVRAEDTIGRVGASELVVAVTVSDDLTVGPLLRRLQHTLDKPIAVSGEEVRLRTSLGVAVAEDAESAEELLARAERSTRVTRRR